jgi:hypothetical protein
VSPILGIIASANQSQYISTTAYESIATFTLGSTTSSITFSSIPQTYKHLQLRCMARNVNSSQGYDYGIAAFNGDSTYTNYRFHALSGDGTAASAGGGQFSGYNAIVADVSRSYYTAGIMGASVTDILDYTNTNKYKVTRMLAGAEMNSGNTYGTIELVSSLWMNTAAITSMTISCLSASLATDSKFALYGIKG